MISVKDKSESRFWLKSVNAWAIYLIAWLTFAAAFTAAFILTDKPSFSRAITATVFVIIPAAILGIGVIWLCDKIPLPNLEKLWTIFIHLVLAFIFPILWIVTVMGIRLMREYAIEPTYNLTLPPDHILHWHLFAGVMIYCTLVSVTYTIDRVKKAEKQRQETEIWMLRSQINPHFLFNTLHSLLSLIRNQPSLAEKSLEQFAALLRHSLQVNRDTVDAVSFAEEWTFTDYYLDLERLRLADRLKVETDFDEQAMNCFVPVFLLQPLIENSIRYAISPLEEGGKIWINAKCKDDFLSISVKDNGQHLAEPIPNNSSGVALQITRERLIKYFGQKAKFETNSQLNQGFEVKIQVPIIEEPL